LRRAQERASSPKLFTSAKTPRWIAGPDILGYLVDRAFCIGCKRLQVGFQPVGIERPRQQIVDGDIMLGRGSGQPRDETGEARTSAAATKRRGRLAAGSTQFQSYHLD